MRQCKKYQEIVIGGGMNGHVGSERDYERAHEKYRIGERKRGGEKVLDFASSYELAIINKYFRKRENI